MEVNKVDLANGETLIDLTSDTVTPQTLAKGVTAHNSKGEQIIGNLNPEGGGSSGGIIDVTELPTENIDENAVYRITETIQTEKTEAYRVSDGYVTSFVDIMVGMGIPASNIHKYVVDELPTDMKPSDVESYTELNFYFLRTDCKVYMYVAGYGVITLAIMLFQDPSYDKGFTDNVYAETEDGIYTTFEAYKDIVRWFVRKNGEWKEITAYVRLITPHGFEYPDTVSGDLTTRVFSGVDIISGDFTEIDNNWFLKRDGTFLTLIPQNKFQHSKLKTATIPQFIESVGSYAFGSNYYLEVVTFRAKCYVSPTAFENCSDLTTINVPWSEGEVSGAPWGATNATINYNYTGG